MLLFHPQFELNPFAPVVSVNFDSDGLLVFPPPPLSKTEIFQACVCVCRQKITQQYSQQVSSALQQWEAEAHRAEEQEEKFNVGPLLASIC